MVLFFESKFSIFIIFNPIGKFLILHDFVTRYVQERVSKTADLLDFPLYFHCKREGKPANQRFLVHDLAHIVSQTHEKSKILQSG